MGLPLLHTPFCTYCPSKSRKIVAVADGKLFKLGTLYPLNEMSNRVEQMSDVKNFFISIGF
jgi:hypothetical protein